jgi:hypothetical protein
MQCINHCQKIMMGRIQKKEKFYTADRPLVSKENTAQLYHMRRCYSMWKETMTRADSMLFMSGIQSNGLLVSSLENSTAGHENKACWDMRSTWVDHDLRWRPASGMSSLGVSRKKGGSGVFNKKIQRDYNGVHLPIPFKGVCEYGSFTLACILRCSIIHLQNFFFRYVARAHIVNTQFPIHSVLFYKFSYVWNL